MSLDGRDSIFSFIKKANYKIICFKFLVASCYPKNLEIARKILALQGLARMTHAENRQKSVNCMALSLVTHCLPLLQSSVVFGHHSIDVAISHSPVTVGFSQ